MYSRWSVSRRCIAFLKETKKMDQSSPCRAAVGTTSLGHRCFFSAVHMPRRIHIGIPALITCLEGFDGCRTGVSIATVAILQFSE